MTTQAVPLAGLQTIPLSAITPNPLNPRKHFDKDALNELAESIKTHGVRQPILVRPKGKDKFEIVCGERRFRASKLAGKADVPAIVDPDLSDGQALEISILENLQRQDVHPLEEAMGYKALMDMSKDPAAAQTAEAIAAKVGKSIGYVYARLKLLALIPAGREAFLSGAITAGHSVLIARLQPRDQVKAIAACFNTFEGDIKGHDPQNLKFSMIAEPEGALIPEKALREWIQDNINLQLKDVPWDLTDASLVPAAGPCSSCEKRSSSNPALFSELTVKGEDTCFDAECFKGKREAFVQLEVKRDRERVKEENRKAFVDSVGPHEKSGRYERAEELRQLSEQAGYTAAKPDQKVLKQGQWLPAKKGECQTVETGLIVRGENAGTKRLVCCNAACKVHKHHLGPGFSSSGSKPYDHELENFKRHKDLVRGKKKAAVRAQLVRAMVGRIGYKIPAELLREAVTAIVDRKSDTLELLWLLGLDPKAAANTDFKKVLGKAKDAQLNQLVVGAVLLDTLGDHIDDGKARAELLGFAKTLGLKTGASLLKAQDERIAKEKVCRQCGCIEEAACEVFNGSKWTRCSWKEDGLCSNPECIKMEARKAESSAKKPAPKSKK